MAFITHSHIVSNPDRFQPVCAAGDRSSNVVVPAKYHANDAEWAMLNVSSSLQGQPSQYHLDQISSKVLVVSIVNLYFVIHFILTAIDNDTEPKQPFFSGVWIWWSESCDSKLRICEQKLPGHLITAIRDFPRRCNRSVNQLPSQLRERTPRLLTLIPPLSPLRVNGMSYTISFSLIAERSFPL